MPLKQDTNYEVSDSELDELLSDDEDKKPEAGPFGGAITKPRHVTTSCRGLHGESFRDYFLFRTDRRRTHPQRISRAMSCVPTRCCLERKQNDWSDPVFVSRESEQNFVQLVLIAELLHSSCRIRHDTRPRDWGG